MLRNLKLLFFAGASLGQAKKDIDQQCTTDATITPTALTTDAILKKFCEDTSIIPSHKPSNLRLASQKGKIVPASCYTNNTLCEEEKKNWDAHFINPDVQLNNSIFFMSKKVEEQRLIEWKAELDKKLQKAEQESAMNQKQFDLHNEFYQRLILLKTNSIKAETVADIKIGNCGEQAAYSAIGILKASYHENQPVRVQQVFLMTNKDDHYMDSHAFNLINGKGNNVKSIKRKDTQTNLQSLRKASNAGLVCDSYNKGLLKNITDTSQLYGPNGPWHSVITNDVGFDQTLLSQLKYLPLAIQKVYCEEIANMQLLYDPKNQCNLLNKK